MRGQTSLEMLFIAAVVMLVASVVYVGFSEQNRLNIADTTVRTQAGLVISQIAMERAYCADVRLVNISKIDESNTRTYSLYIDPPECGTELNAQNRFNETQARITEALGCRYDLSGLCNGKQYIVRAI